MSETIRSSLNNYYYGARFRKYLVQFAAVFSDLNVAIGKNDYNSETNLIRVPIKYASMDRVVAHIKAENTQNKPLALPMMSFSLQNMSLATDRMKGVGVETRSQHLPVGGDITKDLLTVYKRMPTPIYMDIDLHLYASNTDQHFQMLEQILILFDSGTLQFQTSDSYADWTCINELTLENLTLQENLPQDTSPRVIQSTLSFRALAYISPPANIKKNFISRAVLRMQVVNTSDTFADALERQTGDIIDSTLFDVDEDFPDMPKN